MGWCKTLYVARDNNTQKLALCKITTYSDYYRAAQEPKILELTQGHENIMQLCKYTTVGSEHRLYTEYCKGGILYDVYNTYYEAARPVPEAFLWHVGESILRALCFLQLGIPQEDPSLTPRDDWKPMHHGEPDLWHLFMAPVPSLSSGDTTYPRIVLGDLDNVWVGIAPEDRVHEEWCEDRTVSVLEAVTKTWGQPGIKDWAHHEYHRTRDFAAFVETMRMLSNIHNSKYTPVYTRLLRQWKSLDNDNESWDETWKTPPVSVLLREFLDAKDSVLVNIDKDPLAWDYHAGRKSRPL